MMCYALGALEAFDGIYDIDRVTMTIFQPRRDNISTWSCSKKDLLAWANEVLAPTAALAYEGKGEFKAGDHCQFCKAKATCRKRAEFNLEMARYDFEMPATLDETEIAAILPRIDQLISWAMTSRIMPWLRRRPEPTMKDSRSWKAEATVSTRMRMQSQRL